MKRLTHSLLVFSAVAFLSACGGNGRRLADLVTKTDGGANTTTVPDGIGVDPSTGTVTVPNTGDGGIRPATDPRLVADRAIASFGQVAVGTTSAPISIEVKNVGSASATISQFLVQLPFTLSNNACPQLLAVGASCQISFRVTPTNSGDTAGNVAVEYNGRREVISTLTVGGLTQARFVAAAVNYGQLYAGNTSGEASVTFTNIGQAAAAPSIVSLNHPNFPVTNGGNCGNTVAGGASCTIQVKAVLDPNTLGVVTASVARVTNPDGSTSDVIGTVVGVLAPQVVLHRKVKSVANLLLTFLPTLSPTEGDGGGYHYQLQIGSLFTLPFNSVCNVPIYRGYVIRTFKTMRHAHHMLSLGGESALTYDPGPMGYGCRAQTSTAGRPVRRYHLAALGGVWVDSADLNEQASLRAQGYVESGVIAWIP